MHRPYLDSFSYRYAESQLENERLRRHIKELNSQVSNLKWYNSELKNEKTKSDISSAEHQRTLHSKITSLEIENSDIKSASFLKERDLSNDVKVLSSRLNDSQGRINNLEWLNNELRKEKEGKVQEITELSLEKTRLGNELFRNNNDINEKKKLIDALESRVSHLSSFNSEKVFEVQKLAKERAALSVEKSSLQSKYNTVEALLTKREGEVLDLTRRKQNLLEETITQQQNIKQLNNNLNHVATEKEIAERKAANLAQRNASLLNTSYEQSKALEHKEKTISAINLNNSLLESEKNRLASNLNQTKNLADSLRETNTDLRLNSLKKERQLKQNATMFRSMARNRLATLEEAKNSAIEAERNVELSQLDPISADYSIVDRTFNGLKSTTSALEVSRTVDAAKASLNASLNSSSFSDYYDNKFGSPSSSVQAEIERDLKLYRMEQSLNDSLERLRRNLSPKKY